MKQKGTHYCEAVAPLSRVLDAQQTPTEITERGRVFGTVLVNRLQRALYDPDHVKRQNGLDGRIITPESYVGALSFLLADCAVGHENMVGEQPLPDILKLPYDDGVSEKFRAADITMKLNSLAGVAIKWAEEAYGEDFAAQTRTYFPDAGLPVLTRLPQDSAN